MHRLNKSPGFFKQAHVTPLLKKSSSIPLTIPLSLTHCGISDLGLIWFKFYTCQCGQSRWVPLINFPQSMQTLNDCFNDIGNCMLTKKLKPNPE